ncbi:MAG: nickel/cobalt efflux transporter [Pseudomonadota bacterium]
MDLTGMIEAGGANPVLLFAFALALGALHGLEPGHSKTMMAAYIIAVHGTVKQAILLGVSAAFSHSIIVWVLAMLALLWGNDLIGEELEPWFMIVSGFLVLGIAVWMFWQQTGAGHRHDPDHHHHHHHNHHHEDDHAHTHVASVGLDDPHMDAHARAHADEIRARLASGRTGSWQTILFGLSGGLIPCPAAITVFILCLHLGKVALGVTLVSAFSLGLAATLVAVGVVAAVGLKAVSARTSRFDAVMAAAPWISAALIAVIGLLIIWSGYSHLGHGHAH